VAFLQVARAGGGGDLRESLSGQVSEHPIRHQRRQARITRGQEKSR
jgi:hypothetical protein